jgi:protocatechuate 3,4-dioxygenase beta subunit
MTHTDHLRRREVLAAGAAGLGAFVLGCRPASALRSATSASCLLSPEMTEGPYWIDESLKRRDVTEGMHGVPLILRLSVVRASTCRAIKNADVEIWHAGPDGAYSAFDGP